MTAAPDRLRQRRRAGLRAADRGPRLRARGRYRGRVRAHQPRRTRPSAHVQDPPDDPAGHRRSRHHRDGRRQRRRRGGHLRPGRPELRLLAVVGAAAADSGAHRQPGNGGAARRGHRGGARPVDQRTLRPRLGLVFRRRPVPAELPDDRHRVHRDQPGRRIHRRLQIHCGAGLGGGAGRDHGKRQLPALGAGHVRLHRRHPGADPDAVDVTPAVGARGEVVCGAQHLGGRQLGCGAADHRDRRHHRGALAAVFSAVQHRRQTHHSPIHGLRARRHRPGRIRRGGRRRGPADDR